MENQEELVVDINTTENVNDTDTDSYEDDNSDDVEALKAEIERKELALKQLTARAKRAEGEARALKSKVSSAATPTEEPVSNVDERILQAQGMPSELLKELKVIAQVRNTGLIEAQNDPVFKAVKENFERELKVKEAMLPPSKGSKRAEVKKDLKTPGLSKEEHMRLAKEKMGL